MRTALIEFFLALAFAMVAGGIAYVVGQFQTPAFVTTVTWNVQTNAAGAQPDYASLAAGIRSEEVLASALRNLEVEEGTTAAIAELRESVEVEVEERDGSGARLRAEVMASTSERSEARADAIAGAFREWYAANAVERTRPVLRTLVTNVDDLTARIRSLQVFGPGPDEVDVADLLSQRAELLERRDAVADLLEAGRPLTNLGSASSVTRRVRPRTTRDVIVAAVVGLLASAAMGPRRSRRRRRPGKGSDTGGLPTLAAFPIPAGVEGVGWRPAASRLQDRLLHELGAVRPAVVLVTSVSEETDDARVAIPLAESLARTEHRTLLVDANLWTPSLARHYGIREPDARGTTLDWLQNPLGPHDVVSLSLEGQASLDLVPQFRSTRPAPGMAESLFSGFRQALGRWDGYDAIIVHAAPVLALEDTLHLARHVTGTVLVADPSDRRGRRLKEAADALDRHDLPILGVVALEAPPTDDGPRSRPRGTERTKIRGGSHAFDDRAGRRGRS